MKKALIIPFCIIVLLSTAVPAQNKFPSTGAAGIGTTTPNGSSLLEIKSSTKGFLMSRMTLAQRNAIAAPATGLMIYQTNGTPGFYYYTGNAWKAVASQPGWSLTGNAGTTASNYLGTSDKKNLAFRTNNIQRAVIDSLGNMGIGTETPQSKLEVYNGAITVSSTTSANLIINANASAIPNSNQILFQDNRVTKWALGGSNIGSAGTNDFSLYNYNLASNALTISNSSNNIGIGTTNPQYKLSVNGTIQSKELRVETGWSDYVFEKDYKLPTLENIASYIEKNKHLPGIPSAKEIQDNGLAVGEVQTKMMAKIEELTLYIIEQNKSINYLKKENEKLEAKMNVLYKKGGK